MVLTERYWAGAVVQSRVRVHVAVRLGQVRLALSVLGGLPYKLHVRQQPGQPFCPPVLLYYWTTGLLDYCATVLLPSRSFLLCHYTTILLSYCRSTFPCCQYWRAVALYPAVSTGAYRLLRQVVRVGTAHASTDRDIMLPGL